MLWLINKICEIIFRRNIELVGEYCWFHKYRNYSDGIDLFNIVICFDFYEGDHKPAFEFTVVFVNYIFELKLYNVYHIDKQGVVDKDNI